MPVIGTPVTQPVTTTTQCDDQLTVIPEVTRVDGVLSPSRRLGIDINQGEIKTVQWVMRNRAGNPVDLSGCITSSDSSSSSSSSGASTGRVVVKILEALASGSVVPLALDGSVVDHGTGTVQVTLTSAVSARAGVYLMEWAIVDANDAIIFTNIGYLTVNRGLSGEVWQQGPPSIAEIRLHMRDSGPEDNYLLDSVEFDGAELAACIERPIVVWNETLEFVSRRYTTQTFPYRSRWLDAIVGYLYLIAAQHYRRNLQHYTAGGTAMNDKAKAPEYEAKGSSLVNDYREFVKVRKAQINAEGAFGGTSERI